MIHLIREVDGRVESWRFDNTKLLLKYLRRAMCFVFDWDLSGVPEKHCRVDDWREYATRINGKFGLTSEEMRSLLRHKWDKEVSLNELKRIFKYTQKGNNKIYIEEDEYAKYNK